MVGHDKKHRVSQWQSRQGLHVVFFGVPFLVVIIVSAGLQSTLPVAHYLTYDEGKFHYPTIVKFASELPYFNIIDYNSATTPLYHIFMSAVGRLFNNNLTVLRLTNVLISFFAVVILYRLLVNRLKASPDSAFLLSLIFLMSPYFFGASFVLQPGNTTILLFLLSLNYYLKFRQQHQNSYFFIAAFFIMLLVLSRQTYLYVVLAISLNLLLAKLPTRALLLYGTFIFFAVLPTLLLFVSWHALTPPSFKETHTATTYLNPGIIQFGLAVLGVYGLFFVPANWLDQVLKKGWLIFAIVLVCSLMLIFKPLTTDENLLSGYLPKLARSLPAFKQNSLLYYCLLPMGAVILASIPKTKERKFFVLLFLCFLVVNLPNKIIFQRYFDNAILLVLIFLTSTEAIQGRLNLFMRYSLLALFIGYFFAYNVVAG